MRFELLQYLFSHVLLFLGLSQQQQVPKEGRSNARDEVPQEDRNLALEAHLARL